MLLRPHVAGGKLEEMPGPLLQAPTAALDQPVSMLPQQTAHWVTPMENQGEPGTGSK